LQELQVEAAFRSPEEKPVRGMQPAPSLGGQGVAMEAPPIMANYTGYNRTFGGKAEKMKAIKLLQSDRPPIVFGEGGRGIKTPYDAKIEEAARILRGEDRPAYLPQLYKIEGVDLAEPETWTKVNPILPPVAVEPEPLLSPEKQAEISEAFANFAKIVNETLFIDRLTEIIKDMAEKLTVFIPQMTKTIEEIINLYPNKRVKYLAYHGKRRTRKKNINRIKKYFERLARP
jgi:hypothetical protein